MNDDYQLWNDFRQGDDIAFKQLFERYNRVLYNYGYKFGQNTDLAEDSVQELFVKLWYNRATIGDTISVKNYLFKSLRRILVRKLERNKRFSPIDSIFGEKIPFDVELPHDTNLIQKERLQHFRDQLRKSLSKMSPRQREVVHLRYFEDLSYDEIAEVMGLSVKHTYKLMYRAIDSLRLHLSDFTFAILTVLLPNWRQS